jgi:hypothetical protein
MKSRKARVGTGRSHRRMIVEQLENRAMLAGNVNVTVAGDTLIIRGDNADNSVFVTEVENNRYAVIGFADSDGVATRVNGNEFDVNVPDDSRFIFPSTDNGRNIRNIVIDLKRGDDVVAVGDAPQDLLDLITADETLFGFDLGLGEGAAFGDASGFGSPFDLRGNLTILTGDGNDGVVVGVDEVGGLVLVDTGSGNDEVVVGAVDTPDMFIANSLIILTGRGSDIVAVSFVTVNDHLNIQTGDGADFVGATEFDAGHVLIVTGNQNDQVQLNTFDTDREVVVNTGNGSDGVFVDLFSIGQGDGPRGQDINAGVLTVITGGGSDEVEIVDEGDEFVDADVIVVNLGAGDDSLVLDGVSVEFNVVIDAGAGRDTVAVTNSQIGGTAIILLGAGNDTLNIAGSSGGRLLARGGSGRDEFNSDLELDSNGSDGDVDVREFELFGPFPT